jgi:hypothetical protein
MNTEFEGYAEHGRVSLDRRAEGEQSSSSVFRSDDENGGKTTSDKAHYRMVIEARLTWKQADRLHDYLGMLLRLAPYRLRGGEEPDGDGR